MCVDLGRAVEGHVRERSWSRRTTRERVRRAVEEVGVAEGDVAGPGRHLGGDVGHHDVLGDDADAAVVDDGHRAVAAAVEAAMARLDVTGQPPLVAERELGIALERRAACPASGSGRTSGRAGSTSARSTSVHPTPAARRDAGPSRRPRPPGRARTRRRSPVGQPRWRASGGVEAVEADGELGALTGPHALHPRWARRIAVCMGTDTADGLGPGRRRPASQLLDGEVEGIDLVPGGREGGRRRGHVQRLVTQLVGRDEQDPHQQSLISRRVPCTPAPPVRGAPAPRPAVSLRRRSPPRGSAWAARRAASTSSGVSPRAKRKPR